MDMVRTMEIGRTMETEVFGANVIRTLATFAFIFGFVVAASNGNNNRNRRRRQSINPSRIGMNRIERPSNNLIVTNGGE